MQMQSQSSSRATCGSIRASTVRRLAWAHLRRPARTAPRSRTRIRTRTRRERSLGTWVGPTYLTLTKRHFNTWRNVTIYNNNNNNNINTFNQYNVDVITTVETPRSSAICLLLALISRLSHGAYYSPSFSSPPSMPSSAIASGPQPTRPVPATSHILTSRSHGSF